MLKKQKSSKEEPAWPSRACRYTARVEAYLPALLNDRARREFIVSEMLKWEERYARFTATDGSSHRRGDSPDQPSAFDFVETIAALDALHRRYAPPATSS